MDANIPGSKPLNIQSLKVLIPHTFNSLTPINYLIMKKYVLLSLFTSLPLVILTGCKDHRNEMLDWGADIPKLTHLDTVRKYQPDYLIIDWENPDTLGNTFTRYSIIKIKGNRDILKMAYFLEFDDNKYRGLFAHK